MSAAGALARAIAWIEGPHGGCWGSPAELAVPLDDRGLRLADGLFETVLVEGGRCRLLAEHLERWRASAELLGMAPPPPAAALAARIEEAIDRAGLTAAGSAASEAPGQGAPCGALRLNWSRGSMAPGCRGIEPPLAGDPQPRHRFWLELHPVRPCFEPVRVIVSRSERRVAGSLLSRCKTFAYGASIQARREARAAGADDALLESTAGGLCCGTAANLLVRRGRRWLTPPLASGCLPGVMRGRALALDLAEEAPLTIDDLLEGEGAVLLNSLGCRPLLAAEGSGLARTIPCAEAEALWTHL